MNPSTARSSAPNSRAISESVVLILGATSAMAEHAAREHAERGDRLILVARSPEKLVSIKTDLIARGAVEVTTVIADLADMKDHADVLMSWLECRLLARAYIFFGVLGQQNKAQYCLKEAERLIQVNYNAPAAWSLAVANVLELQKSGCLVVAGSVAGDRGRMSNHIYGSAKAALSILIQGIDHRLSKSDARAVVIRYGFVISPMTEGMRRTGLLWTSAKRAGQLAIRAGDSKRGIIYAPGFWLFIMTIIRLVPTWVFNKTNL